MRTITLWGHARINPLGAVYIGNSENNDKDFAKKLFRAHLHS
ncbi:MAG: hypothetical protein ABSC47_01690 [Terracidiphilus sp.]